LDAEVNKIPNEPESSGGRAKETNLAKKEKTTPPITRRTPESSVFFILGRYDSYVTLANQKASFLIAAATIVFVAAIVKRSDILAATEIASVAWFNDLLYLIAGLGLFGVLGLSLLIVVPITKSGDKQHGEYKSFIAYSSVAKIDVETFRSRLSSTDYDFWNDLVRQTHQMAKLLAVKFQILGWASWLAFVSTVSIAILFLLAAF
jgi:hypothetical protein